jgi:hypothetical protein
VQRYTRFARLVLVPWLFLRLQHLYADNQALLFHLPVTLARSNSSLHVKLPCYLATGSAK